MELSIPVRGPLSLAGTKSHVGETYPCAALSVSYKDAGQGSSGASRHSLETIKLGIDSAIWRQFLVLLIIRYYHELRSSLNWHKRAGVQRALMSLEIPRGPASNIWICQRQFRITSASIPNDYVATYTYYGHKRLSAWSLVITKVSVHILGQSKENMRSDDLLTIIPPAANSKILGFVLPHHELDIFDVDFSLPGSLHVFPASKIAVLQRQLSVPYLAFS